jgi:hypothetical protein
MMGNATRVKIKTIISTEMHSFLQDLFSVESEVCSAIASIFFYTKCKSLKFHGMQAYQMYSRIPRTRCSFIPVRFSTVTAAISALRGLSGAHLEKQIASLK